MNTKTYPRTNDYQTIYLNTIINNPNIIVGDYTIYNDFVNDPAQFEKNNVLYHYPINQDRLIIGKFCSIACGAKFLFNSANHTLKSLSNYTFPLFFEEWGLNKKNVTSAWDNKGDIIIDNDTNKMSANAATSRLSVLICTPNCAFFSSSVFFVRQEIIISCGGHFPDSKIPCIMAVPIFPQPIKPIFFSMFYLAPIISINFYIIIRQITSPGFGRCLSLMQINIDINFIFL